MSRDDPTDADQALSVLRDIWHAHGQTAAELDARLGHRGKACKNLKHVGFGTDAEPVDDDLRAAWRRRLASEGKLAENGVSVHDLVLGQGE
jgi:hypothetical protein